MKKLITAFFLICLFSCTEKKSLPQDQDKIPEGMQLIPPGILSSDQHSYNEERTIPAFFLDQHPVTVGQFRQFIKATGYVTEAEKLGNAGVLNVEKQSWVLVNGANWQYPMGKDKPPARDDYPVTQVSWQDALAYCQWSGKRLPTVAEWEYAAHNNGKSHTRFSWGDELIENGKFMANVWQGKFPAYNTVEDGYATVAPVGIFGKTQTGLSDMGGNVWQWTADTLQTGEIILKGGSFLCDSTVCNNYRIAGYTTTTPETSLFHIGFRCAKDVE